MTVRVRFQLRRRGSIRPAPAEALFVPGRGAASLLSACTRLGLDPSGRVHDVAGGFLLRLAEPTSEPVPGATRLRELSDNLFVPVDAELVPSLLDDEASGLVRDGGLVFLPGGLVLRFDRKTPVGLPSLLDAPPRPRREWRPMPEPRPLAERIVEVSREWPEPPAEELYRELEEHVRRPDRSRPRGEAGRAQGDAAEDTDELEGGGSGEAGGRGAGRRGLGEAVRDLFGRAGSGARSLGEKLKWGMLDHSGLVQKLLREFRQGDAEQALRHALPMAPAERGSGGRMASLGDGLPFSRAIYNLFDLLGRPSRGGTVGVWQARPDLVEELKREYRRAAEQAIRRGDFRRAAYIYGRLLDDHRMAAQALQRGGLHHDAAILYLKKLNDKAAAAQAFDAAGMVDRAIVLYRELGRHEAAGDLLRRIGDEAGARTAYLFAAQCASDATPPDWLEAGRILSRKAGLMDEAIVAYRRGWIRRPAANATACALELVAIHAPRGEAEPLRAILDEADALYRSLGYESDAGLFYNRMAVAVGAVPELSAFADEVHDRARLALADHLRRKVEAGELGPATVLSVFAEPKLWAPAFVRDAQFAASSAADRRKTGRAGRGGHGPQAERIELAREPIVAACQASQAADIFLAGADGRIAAYRPRGIQVLPVGQVAGGVASMEANASGEVLVALSRGELGALVCAFLQQPDGSFRGGSVIFRSGSPRSWLTPIVSLGAESFVGIGDDRELHIVEASSGLTAARIPFEALEDPPATACLLSDGEGWRVLTHDGARWVVLDRDGRCRGRSSPAWRPFGGGRGHRCAVPLSWTYLDEVLRVVGLDEHGAVHTSLLWIVPDDDWSFPSPRAIDLVVSQCRSGEGAIELLASPMASVPGGYLAATAIGPDRVAAVSADRVDWLREASDRFRTAYSVQDPGLARTVACFPSSSPDEILVVSSDRRVSRVGVPRQSRSRQANV